VPSSFVQVAFDLVNLASPSGLRLKKIILVPAVFFCPYGLRTWPEPPNPMRESYAGRKIRDGTTDAFVSRQGLKNEILTY